MTPDQIPKILETLNIEFKYKKGTYSFPCPVHGGDNHSACTIFEGKFDIPNWACWTHQCQNTYGKGLYGFIKGVLSYRNGGEVDFKSVNNFLTGKNIDSISIAVDTSTTQKKLITQCFSGGEDKNTKNIDPEYIRRNLVCPSPYFMSRGFCKEVLDTFHVGDSYQEGRQMYQRAVVPVYDIDGKYAGCCGRTIIGHPDKWVYSFCKGNFLYGLNFSLPYIKNSGKAIIVEGNPDVWKIFSLGFKNVVAIMGTAFTDEQLLLLEQSGALELIILTDMDAAGRECADRIINRCGRRFNYRVPTYNGKDPGETLDEELIKILEK